MQVIAGYDPLDPASADIPVPRLHRRAWTGPGRAEARLPALFLRDAPRASHLRSSPRSTRPPGLAKLGAKVEEITLPDFELFNACGRIILTAEAYAIHEQDLLSRPLDYGRYTYQRMMLGATISAADLIQALRLRRELAAAVNGEVLDELRCDVTANGLTAGAALRRVPTDVPPSDAADHAVQRHRQSGAGDPDRLLQERAAARHADRRAARSTSRPCCASAPPTKPRPAGSRSARRSLLQLRLDAPPTSLFTGSQCGVADDASSREGERGELSLGVLRRDAQAAADDRQRRPRHHRHAQRRARVHSQIRLPRSAGACRGARPRRALCGRPAHPDRPDRDQGREAGSRAGGQDPRREAAAGLGLQHHPPARRHAAGRLPRDAAHAYPARCEAQRRPAALGPRPAAGAVLRHHGRRAAEGLGPHHLDRAARARRQPRQQGAGRRRDALSARVRRGRLFSCGDGHGAQGDGEVASPPSRPRCRARSRSSCATT